VFYIKSSIKHHGPSKILFKLVVLFTCFTMVFRSHVCLVNCWTLLSCCYEWWISIIDAVLTSHQYRTKCQHVYFYQWQTYLTLILIIKLHFCFSGPANMFDISKGRSLTSITPFRGLHRAMICVHYTVGSEITRNAC